MSIIGPRPGDVESKDTYAEDEKDKLLIRPGITGYTQKWLAKKTDTACIRQKGKIYNLKVSHITLVDIFLHVHYNKHRKNTHGIPRK